MALGAATGHAPLTQAPEQVHVDQEPVVELVDERVAGLRCRDLSALGRVRFSGGRVGAEPASDHVQVLAHLDRVIEQERPPDLVAGDAVLAVVLGGK